MCDVVDCWEEKRSGHLSYGVWFVSIIVRNNRQNSERLPVGHGLTWPLNPLDLFENENSPVSGACNYHA